MNPLTTIMLPKNSGFQIGDTSLGRPSQARSGMKGICSWDASRPSKKARLSG